MSLDNLKVSLTPRMCFFWRYFNDNSVHEMKISKVPLPVLPYLSYQVAGLNPDTMYSMGLHFETTSKRQFRYREREWWPFGNAAKHGPPKQVRHERGILSGKEWMGEEISFQSMRISCNFEAKSELEIPLHLNHKYKPVLSIREEPTLEKPNPPVIMCCLGHTEFVTVREIQNNHVSFLKRMDEEGYGEREALLEMSVVAPPIFAKCIFKNAPEVLAPELITSSLSTVLVDCDQRSVKNDIDPNDLDGTPVPHLPEPQAVIFSVSNQQEENDGTQEQNTNETPSTSPSDSVHPLSVRNLNISMVKKEVEDPKQNEENVTPEPFFKNYPLDLLKQIMVMNAENAMNINFDQNPTIMNQNKKMKISSEREMQEEVARTLQGGNACPGVDYTLQSHVIPNDSFMPQFQFSTSHNIFSPQTLFPTFPSFTYPSPFSYPSSLTGYPSPDFTYSMPQLPLVYPQFPSMIPSPLTQPPQFGLFPHTFSASFPPMFQPPVYPPHQYQFTGQSRKRPFQENTQ